MSDQGAVAESSPSILANARFIRLALTSRCRSNLY